MDKKQSLKKFLLKTVSYILVAALASAGTWFAAAKLPNSKLEVLEKLIQNRFIGEVDKTAIEDLAAYGMVAALGDKWSTYIPAASYTAYKNNQNNSYIGLGVTVQQHPDGLGILITEVNPDGPAAEAGIQAGDIITHADGNDLRGKTTAEARTYLMGEKNKKVALTILREDTELEITVTNKEIHSKTTESQMLEGNVGYILIKNFYASSGDEAIAEVEKLMEQGAQTLIFDVRNNPGGYVDEMVKVLDYLLPEGVLFRSTNYAGQEDAEMSDADCLEIPMAVLINGQSYSAAEFFAAALSEYEWAVLVGEPSTGKGYYQTTIQLGDGSAVKLSTGRYTTPNGVNLTETGGLTPDILVQPAETAVIAEEDPQILAAADALKK